MNQRGVIATFYLYAIAALAVLGVLYGLFQAIDSRAYQRGKLAVQRDWDAANAHAQEAADAERLERQRITVETSKRLQSAEASARDSDARWRAARAASRDKPLVVGQCPDPVGKLVGEPSNAPAEPILGPVRLRLAWHAVGLWDSSWTGPDGQPVFGDSTRAAEEAVAAGPASPYTFENALDNHAENASICSANSRQLSSLITLIETLRAR